MLWGLMGCVCVLAPGGASAEEVTKETCVDSHLQAQSRRLEGRFIEAEESLRTCANEACPEIVQRDCVQWLEEVQDQVPTVVFEAFDEDGAVRDVKVTHAGRVLAASLDGMAVELDPGTYDLVFELPDGRRRMRRVLVRQADRNRAIGVDFAEHEESGDDWVLRVPPAARVSGVATVVATGVAAGFGASALIRQSHAVQSCAPACREQVSRQIAARAAVADVAGGVAVVSGVVTIVLTARASGRGRTPRQERVTPTVMWNGGTGFVALEGVF
jgi:hypothetical protein